MDKSNFIFFLKIIYYFWLHWVFAVTHGLFVDVCRLSLVVITQR